MSWWNTNWTYRKKLTFANNAYEAFTNFTVLVHLKDGGGAGRIDVDFADIKAGGADIRFVDDNDSTELKYEIERWDDGAEEAWVWVKVPTLAKSNTDFIYIYYGNPAASHNQNAPNTWDTYFQAVYHFNGNVLDSKGLHNGTNSGTSDIAGKLGRGRDFNPNDYISLGDWELAGNHTFEAWVNFDSLTNKPTILSKSKTTPQQFVAWWWHETTRLRYLRSNDGNWPGYAQPVSGISTGTWYYCVMAISGSTIQLYVSGASIGTGTTDSSTFNISDAWQIGRMIADVTSTYLNAKVDEVRMASTRRSSNWVAAQYKSMTDSYITPGAKECQKIFTETINLTDSFSRTLSIHRTFTETLTLTDTINVFRMFHKVFTEILILSDTLKKKVGKVFTENINLSDVFSRKWSIYRTYTETITLADTVAKKVAKTFLEAITLTDTIKKKIAKTFTENISLNDTFSRIWSIYRTFSESLTLSDTLSKKVGKIFRETLHLTDSFSRIWTIYRTFTEKITLTDKVKAAKVNLVNLIKKLIRLFEIGK